ncbi:Hypothetical predicted protein, partial [Scomber scombrus]
MRCADRRSVQTSYWARFHLGVRRRPRIQMFQLQLHRAAAAAARGSSARRCRKAVTCGGVHPVPSSDRV